MDQIPIRSWICNKAGKRPFTNMLESRTDVNHAERLWFQKPEDFIDVFSHQAESFFTLPQGFFREPLLRHVVGYSPNQGDAYPVCAKAVVVFPNPALATFGQDHHGSVSVLGFLNVLEILVKRRVPFLQQ